MNATARGGGQSPNGPLATLFAHAAWNSDLGLAFSVMTFNRAAFLDMLKPQGADFDRLDVARGQDRWWTWPAEDDGPRPSWWNVPVAFVVSIYCIILRPKGDRFPSQPRPLTMHSSDLADMQRQSDRIAGVLDGLIVAKTRMTETLTERVSELERDVYSVI